MGTNFNERIWLDWLVKVRIIIITLLLAIELAIMDLAPSRVPKRGFIVLILLCYTISVFYLLLLYLWRDHRTQARLQVVSDLVFATSIVYVCGGIDSTFHFLYPLIIIVASVLLPRSWTYLTASLAFIFYGAVLELGYFGIIPSYSSTRPNPQQLQIVILINLFAYLAIAYLANRLSTKLRQVDNQLQDKSGALENLQALHENIVNCISGGLVTTTPEGVVTLVNPAGRRLLERKQEELIGRPIGEFFIDRLPAPGGSGELRCLTPSGKQKTLGIAVSELRVPEHGAVGAVCSFEDLTEIRRLEREVRMHDRLAAVGRMAAAIAHEIRNPLSSIAGSVKVFADTTSLNNEQRMLMDIVTRESERLNSIISDFLTYTRERRFQFQVVDLLPLLEDTLTLLQNQPEVLSHPEPQQAIRIVREFETNSAMAAADGDAIKQVFWNVCENAVRAMPQGGSLTVGLRGTREHWQISFADTGIGVTEKQLEKIFEPFQSSFARGTGLGLAIVYQIVQAHQGKIAVQSAPAEGTRFTLQLKRAAQVEAPVAIAASGGAHG
jgi:two-component system, NtrC family, sensor histidine kinase PilS